MRVTVMALALALVAALALSWSTSRNSAADPTDVAPAGPSEAASAAGEAQRAGTTAGRHGTGRTYRKQWFGTWKFGSRVGYCIEFDQGHPNTTSIKGAPSQLPRLSKSTSARVKYIVANYGTTGNADNAAAAAIAVWKLQGTKKFATYYAKMVKAKAIPKAVQRRASAILAESKNHGPYALSMTLGAGLPGQVVNGSVTVRAANRTAMAGRAITLSATNAAIVSRSSSTNRAGTYAFRARVSGTGQIRIGAKLVFNSLRGLYISSPTAGHQRIVMAGGVKDTASAFRTSVRTFNGARMENRCDGDCNGVAPLVATMRNECGSRPMRQQIYVNGKLAADWGIAPCTTGTKKFTAGDEAKVTTRYCYTDRLNGPCRTAMAAGPSMTAECPPMATFRYEATCDCEAPKQFTFTVVGPKQVTRRSYTAVLTVSGQATQTLTLVGNGTKTFRPVTAPPGTKVKLTAKVLNKTFVLDELTVG